MQESGESIESDHCRYLRSLKNFLQKQQIELVIDIGANRGQFAKYVRSAGFKGSIVSFEPLKDAFLVLEQATLEDKKWDCYKLAVSSRRGKATMYRTQNEWSSSLQETLDNTKKLTPRLESAGTEQIESITLAEALNLANAKKFRTFLKLDTQGHEAAILSSNPNSLQRICAIQVELSVRPLYENEAFAHDIVRFLVAYGFAVHHLIPGFRDENTRELLQFDLLASKTQQLGHDIEKIESLARLPGREFTSFHYERINARRLEHLSSLGLPIGGKSVLELGAGIGDLTSFFLDRNCRVTTSDARPELLSVLRNRHRGASVVRIDANKPPRIDERYDIVFCAGLLYHLEKPAVAIRFMAKSASGFLILSTVVSAKGGNSVNLVAEDAAIPSQATTGTGSRPTRHWIANQLKKHFPFVYFTAAQPKHPQFPTDWQNPGNAQFKRAVFIASKEEFDLPSLVTEMPVRHVR